MNIQTIALIGRPGCGKGTQSTLLSKELGFDVFSTGDEFRKIATHDTPVGHRVGEVVNNGGLMPFWFAAYLFEKAVLEASHDTGLIFEGMGRKFKEAKLFDDVMGWLARPYKVICLVVSEKEAIERLHGRRQDRADDQFIAVTHRLKEYEEHTVDAIKYFKDVGNLIEINGEQEPSAIHNDIMKALAL